MKPATKRAVHLYHCDACGRPITAVPGDAVYKPGSRTLCAGCVSKPTARAETNSPPKADGRGAAAKARWEAMSPEAKKAKIEKMQAARTHNKEAR
jgi:hypothetical protein